MKRHILLPCTLLATLSLTACDDDTAEGTLDVRIYGEAFIEDGIPAEVFNDGWSMQFSRFLVAVDQIDTEDGADDGRYVYDLHAASMGAGHEVTGISVPSGEQLLGFRIAPGGSATGGNASDADAGMMMAMGYSLFVEGTATKDAAQVAFAWGFDSDTTYRECEVVESVPDGGNASTMITIHADHILYDDLESMTPNTSFDLIAASDADLDGTVTADELRAKDITAEARYQVGSQGITNLWDYMNALTRTVGHIDGEGECKN
ncbi:MAG: hypothetical protein IAG13_16690 [Deltaproteobacteria bacterium]|nr:hypothetical protein [Nannocystaceae bacterium]